MGMIAIYGLISIVLMTGIIFLYYKRKKIAHKNVNTTENDIASNSKNKIDMYASDVIPEKYQYSAESLIDYLKIRSNNVEIKYERFNINHVLNELSGSLAGDYLGKKIELIFDIDNSVPRYITGDSLHLGQILTSLVKSIIEDKDESEIKLEISKQNNEIEKNALVFRVIDMQADTKELKNSLLTMPYYDEEKASYVGLDLFVANELVMLMDGRLSVETSSITKHPSFILELPCNPEDWKERRRYRLPSKELTHKKVLVCDENHHASLAVEKLLQYFNYKVDIVDYKLFQAKKIDMSSYDMVILHENLFIPVVNQYIRNMKSKYGLKVLALSNIFSGMQVKIEVGIVDRYLIKPLSQERIFEAIMVLLWHYKPQNPIRTEVKKLTKTDRLPLKIHRDFFQEKENITPQSFKDFSGKKLLIVEDNRINQKILTSILAESGMQLTIANNGKEAIDFVLKNPPDTYDFVLMDINMPIMDGFSATAMIRKEEKYNILPIVALTALVLDTEISKIFEHGVNGYLSKPLKVGELYSALAFFMEASMPEKAIDKNISTPVKKIVEMECIDFKQGISYADNNEALYREVLREFLNAFSNSDKKMRSLVDDKNNNEIKNFCMDMRSLTKTIGAHSMHDVVDRMYKLFLYNNQHMIPKYTESYVREIKKLNDAIKRYLEGDKI